MIAAEKSGAEIAALVLKAARGGGLPLGLAEDLAQAVAYVDLDAITSCPCRDHGAAYAVPAALDTVVAVGTPQQINASPALIDGYIAGLRRCVRADHRSNDTILHPANAVPEIPPLGRRAIPPDLHAHLIELAERTHVPDTDASRIAGAGAGLTDND